jgi:hypothetical protein
VIEVAKHCKDSASKTDEEADEVGHGSGLGPLFGAKALQLTIACLRERDQMLAEREARLGCGTLQKVADGCLAATADRSDLHLAKTALLNA